MTGRGFGYCADSEAPGYAYPGARWGGGRGRGGGGWGGGGRGWRHRFYATGRPFWARDPYPGPAWGPAPRVTREQELEGLRNEAEWLKGQLDAINQRVQELEEE